MKIPRRFTKKLNSPYADQVFEVRKSEIKEPDGRVIFSQENVTVPKDWSQVATDVLAQKYFRRRGVPLSSEGNKTGGEHDARQVFHRLAGCWTDWGKRHGYFSTDEDANHFYDEVCYMLSHQMAAPNSPQWFNTGLHWAYGIEGPPQGHYFVNPATNQVERSTSAYERPAPHAAADVITDYCLALPAILRELLRQGGDRALVAGLAPLARLASLTAWPSLPWLTRQTCWTSLPASPLLTADVEQAKPKR
mgnify:CR=1 FL=1